MFPDHLRCQHIVTASSSPQRIGQRCKQRGRPSDDGRMLCYYHTPAMQEYGDGAPDTVDYRDTGCDLHDKCLTCPFVVCQYDLESAKPKAKAKEPVKRKTEYRREQLIAHLQQGKSLVDAALLVGIKANAARRIVPPEYLPQALVALQRGHLFAPKERRQCEEVRIRNRVDAGVRLGERCPNYGTTFQGRYLCDNHKSLWRKWQTPGATCSIVTHGGPHRPVDQARKDAFLHDVATICAELNVPAYSAAWGQYERKVMRERQMTPLHLAKRHGLSPATAYNLIAAPRIRTKEAVAA